MRTGILLLGLFFFLTQCREPQETVATHIPRDTTITPELAVTLLQLDSLYVDSLIRDLDETERIRLRNFYNSRNYQFAWFNEDGLAAQARAFWNLHNQYVRLTGDSSALDRQLHEQMERMTRNEEEALEQRDYRTLELQLTRHFFEYAQYAYAGRIDPEELQWHIPRRKVDAVALLDSLVRQKGKKLEDWEPVSRQYRRIKEKLLQYYELEKMGPWEELKISKRSYRRGDSSPELALLKRRLALLGDLSGEDTSQQFTPAMEAAVRLAQKRFGLEQDGIIGNHLLRGLNVAPEQRVEQMLINMERMRWMPREPEGRRIVANIPEFRLHVWEGDTQVLSMKVVVGKAANRTVVFNDELKYVVFSPYWNVPQRIVRSEILPAMRRNPGYLDRNNMEQTGLRNGLPVIRQKPGGRNALGKVKFIFPNSYNIYFHDTPSKGLFQQESRAFSHGCIRLSDPFGLAQYLLQDQPEWTSERILAAMNRGEEKWVSLSDPVPVFLSYFTAWVDEEGLLHFRDDIYGHDQAMAKHLFRHTDHE